MHLYALTLCQFSAMALYIMTTATLEALEQITPDIKVPLSAPLIARYLMRGYTQSQIARACKVSAQAVSSYIKAHYDDLAPLVDDRDVISAIKSKHIANKLQDKVLKVLDTVDAWDKKDLYTMSTVQCQQIDKYRLLSDKSTQNVDMAQVTTNRKELQQQIIDVQARIKSLKGSEIDLTES